MPRASLRNCLRLLPSMSAQRAALWASAAAVCCGVQFVRLSCGGTLRCGAESLIHLVRTLCMWVKIAAMVRTLPAGFAVHSAGARWWMRSWLMRSQVTKMCAAVAPGCEGGFG